MTLLEVKSYKLRPMVMIKLWTYFFSSKHFIFYLTCSLKEVLSLKNKNYEDADDMFYITFPDVLFNFCLVSSFRNVLRSFFSNISQKFHNVCQLYLKNRKCISLSELKKYNIGRYLNAISISVSFQSEVKISFAVQISFYTYNSLKFKSYHN